MAHGPRGGPVPLLALGEILGRKRALLLRQIEISDALLLGRGGLRGPGGKEEKGEHIFP